jgi:transcriptional regulator with XRE-family HTH domain
LRKAAGLKAVRLAELLDVTPMQVSRWENGRKPLERRAVALVSALAVEQLEGKAATLAVLEALAASKKRPKSVRFHVKAAG